MTKKKNKFDLSGLVHDGALSEGQSLFFVSDPSKFCQIARQPNGEYKLTVKGAKLPTTVHAFVTQCLGQEPQDHASKWLRTEGGKTLFDLWHADDMAEAA